MPDEPLIIGTFSVCWPIPIIGPPIITFPGSSEKPPHSSIRSDTIVPILTRRFFWYVTTPVTVVILSINGLPKRTALYMAAAVPTFWTTTPTSIGRPPEGTSRFKVAFISCFSAPCGYFTSKPITRIFGPVSTSFVHSMPERST